MRAGGDEDGDVLVAHARHLREQRLDLLLSGLGARDVADRNGDALARPPQVPQRRPSDRCANRAQEGLVRVWHGRAWHRLDDRDAVVGQIHRKTVGSVIQVHFHR
jgi:hypothetical protein